MSQNLHYSGDNIMMGRQSPPQSKLFYTTVSLEERVRKDHPLRKIAQVVDFDFIYGEVEGRYGINGNVSVAPPVILKMMLLLILYNVRSERELMSTIPERLDWLWFLGYDLDDEIIRPYFKLENVRDGVFYVANQLFGLQFIERTDIPKYHPDVTVFEVQEADGAHVGILYTDYFPRASKRGGAWMNSFRKQYHKNGKMITPIICNVGNFTKPTGDKPSLLTFEEAATMFHEFGHALHGLLSDCTYRRLSGTAVPRDFVELPSQIMENWALHPEVIKIYAKHYQTGEPIPQELLDKINNARLFNLGFATVEYLAASFLDMDWHTLEEPVEKDPIEFEDQSMEKIGLIPEIVVRYRSPYFSHIFSGGYSAGYYSYIWAEVLDADAFEAFKQKGLFDQETAQALRKHIYSAGGTDEPMELYKKFRGHEPKVEPLLRRKGFIE